MILTDRDFINVDIQMRTNVPHIFAIGDIVGQPMLAHKAVDERHVAGERRRRCWGTNTVGFRYTPACAWQLKTERAWSACCITAHNHRWRWIGCAKRAASSFPIRRSHQINRHPRPPETLRDTCVYSIVASEWPTVREHLTHQLSLSR
jgi:pyruvate/2-oxoglutarate dehydrogenase complex dihydrolipoamide dehydrogenase (E3) component